MQYSHEWIEIVINVLVLCCVISHHCRLLSLSLSLSLSPSLSPSLPPSLFPSPVLSLRAANISVSRSVLHINAHLSTLDCSATLLATSRVQLGCICTLAL